MIIIHKCLQKWTCENARPRVLCATDGRTYPSRCHMRRQGCLDNIIIRSEHKGPCAGEWPLKVIVTKMWHYPSTQHMQPLPCRPQPSLHPPHGLQWHHTVTITDHLMWCMAGCHCASVMVGTNVSSASIYTDGWSVGAPHLVDMRCPTPGGLLCVPMTLTHAQWVNLYYSNKLHWRFVFFLQWLIRTKPTATVTSH